MNNKRKILVLVEGARTDVRLVEHLIQIYEIDSQYEVVSYNTNIYTLYNAMFAEGYPEDMDILQVLKEREKDSQSKEIFNDRYSDILLIFDLDPHDGQFSSDKIYKMTSYFVESSDMGKLYLNYPMVEAFYHMKSIPDDIYNSCYATIVELKKGTYKQRVNQENRNKDYRKFATTRDECNIVIKQNIEKSWYILGKLNSKNDILPDSVEILNEQLDSLSIAGKIYVLCTCVFFIAEYNPEFLN